MLNTKNKLWRWGWIDARLLFGTAWIEGAPEFYKEHGMGFAEMLCYFKNEQELVVLEHESLFTAGEPVFNKYILDQKARKKAFERWEKTVKIVNSYQKNMIKDSLKNIKDLEEYFRIWYDNHIDFWRWGFITELANWGGENILSKSLKKNHPEDYALLLERLAAPIDLSFYQKEELDLLKISLLDKHIQNEALKKHQQEYFWLLNSYHGSKVLPICHFQEKLLENKEEARQKIENITNFGLNTKKEKEQIIEKYQISQEIQDISHALSYSIWWQDYRKQFIFMLSHQTHLLAEEISRRLDIQMDDIYYYTLGELKDLLLGKPIPDSELNARKKSFLYIYSPPHSLQMMSGEKVDAYMKPFVEEKFDRDQTEFTGTVVSAGSPVTGIVHIMKTPREVEKMKKGEILVTTMTTPDYIVAMRKASAIITDEGGMTSHAAIVARELKIPCIVGTKIATKILKSGELVEVDTGTGVVRRK